MNFHSFSSLVFFLRFFSNTGGKRGRCARGAAVRCGQRIKTDGRRQQNNNNQKRKKETKKNPEKKKKTGNVWFPSPPPSPLPPFLPHFSAFLFLLTDSPRRRCVRLCVCAFLFFCGGPTVSIKKKEKKREKKQRVIFVFRFVWFLECGGKS